MTTLRTVTETAAELGKEARESIEELGRSAGRKLDEARDETGGALHSAASSVRRAGREGSAVIDNCSTRTADRLDATASYIEDHDLGDAFTGLRQVCSQASDTLSGSCGCHRLSGRIRLQANDTLVRESDSRHITCGFAGGTHAVHEPGAVAFASSRSAAIRFCSVRRLIPNISAASLRLPRT